VVTVDAGVGLGDSRILFVILSGAKNLARSFAALRMTVNGVAPVTGARGRGKHDPSNMIRV
jgi:hypothetical protein